MDKNKILLAFKDDEETRKSIGYLSNAGFEVSTVKDGARAIELAIGEVPSIIVTDLDLPVINGERIFHILRNNPHTSKIPFLFVSDGIADIKGFRAGVDIFLLRPLNMEELYGRIRQTLSFKNGSQATAKELEGSLAHMSVPDILQFLHLNKKEGELRIISGEMCGMVLIKGGEIYNCVLDEAEKEKALFRMLQWNEGNFEFIPGTVSIDKRIRSSTGNLLMEGMRQIDEFRKKRDQLPDKKTVVRTKVELKALPKGLNPIIYELVELLKVYTRVEDIVEHCSYPDYEAYKSLATLISKGIIEEVKTADVDSRKEFLTRDQAISIREKIISRYSDVPGTSHGKIFLIATSGSLAVNFIRQCGRIPGFSVDSRLAFKETKAENPFGEVGSIRLHGGLELVLFSIPTVRSMGPLWTAFSTNLAGLILLWDGTAGKDIKELINIKKEIMLRKRVPVVHICGDTTRDDTSYYKKEFSLKADEPLFGMDNRDREMIFEIFYTLFGNLIKDDYVSA